MILTHYLETKASLPNCHTAIFLPLAASVSSILRLTQALKHTTCTCTAHSQTPSAGPNQFFRNSISISALLFRRNAQNCSVLQWDVRGISTLLVGRRFSTWLAILIWIISVYRTAIWLLIKRNRLCIISLCFLAVHIKWNLLLCMLTVKHH